MGPLCAVRRETGKQLRTGEEKVSSLCCSIKSVLEAGFSLFLPSLLVLCPISRLQITPCSGTGILSKFPQKVSFID